MNKAEKENQDAIAWLPEMRKKFEKENDVRSILQVKALLISYKVLEPEVMAEYY